MIKITWEISGIAVMPTTKMAKPCIPINHLIKNAD